MLALLEERQKLEDEAQSKDISNLNRRLSGSNKEVERVKSDLKMTQEYLRIATDTNSELQVTYFSFILYCKNIGRIAAKK